MTIASDLYCVGLCSGSKRSTGGVDGRGGEMSIGSESEFDMVGCYEVVRVSE